MTVADPNFIPPHKQLEIEAMEYMDKTAYIKARSYQIQAKEMGDDELASGFYRQTTKTLSGARTQQDVRSAMTSMDRKYLDAFVGMHPTRRTEMLSKLPTYYQKALHNIWDQDASSIRDHDAEALDYFRTRPMMAADSLLWHPSVPTSAMKIRMIQGGINGVSDNLHRFGFYESQAIETGLRFPNIHYQRPTLLNLPNYSSIKNTAMHSLRRLNPWDADANSTQIRRIHNSNFSTGYKLNQKVDRSEQTFFYVQDLMR